MKFDENDVMQKKIKLGEYWLILIDWYNRADQSWDWYIWIESMTKDYHDPGILVTQDQY